VPKFQNGLASPQTNPFVLLTADPADEGLIPQKACIFKIIQFVVLKMRVYRFVTCVYIQIVSVIRCVIYHVTECRLTSLNS
jgi:hypothetical protein